MEFRNNKLSNIILSDVIMSDHPDFVDAFIDQAYLENESRWLTDDEMEQVPQDSINEYIHENLDLYN